jgi:hypothetical protein
MRRIATITACVFLLGWVSAFAQTVFEPVNNLIVSEPQQQCPNGMVTAIRSGWGADGCGQTPGTEDGCFFYRDTARPLQYGGAGVQNYAAGVAGLYWPGTTSATFDSTPHRQAADAPGFPQDCVDKAEFKQGAAIRARSFSYYIFDLSTLCGSTIASAILKFRVSPWYSNCFQPAGDVPVNLGVYDMNDGCENLVNDAKRGCRGPLAAALIPFTFPLPRWDDYQYYNVNVTQAVQQDLAAPGPNCLTGFILDSDDIDDAPGGRILGLGYFTLEVTQGTPIPTLSQWGMALWVVLLAGAVIVLRVLHRSA